MGMLDFLKQIKKQEVISKTNLSGNPYVTKYDKNKMGIDNVVYLLYCDYADAFKWIKDSKKPEVYFSNYDKATQILEVLNSYRKVYHFKQPTPKKQLQELKSKYTEYTTNFIQNYWNATLKSAEKLKTENGKQKKIQTFFDCLNNYSSRFTPQISDFIIALKHNNPVTIKTEPKILKCGKYTLSTIADIVNIPLSDTEAAYHLQKAATDFKRNNQMDMAIACLRKSNDLSDYNPKPLLMQKDYFRLVKYLEYANLKEEAAIEEKRIYKNHPVFLDKRISNIIGIRETIKKNLESSNDLVLVNTSASCPICSIYNNKVYSISGLSKKYLTLPKEITEDGGFCPNCYLKLFSYFEGISTPPK